MTHHPAAAFARELVASFAVHGVEDFVLCPGSRSGPLAHALAEAASDAAPLGAPRVNLHVRIDERSAAFLALGIARGLAAVGTPRPVAVVTTSGTAVGNLLPAIMEAHHGGVPLIAITADRPGELRGVGANQTTDQVGIFETFVRWSGEIAAPEPHETGGRATRIAARAAALALGDASRDDAISAPGPVHLNVELRDPLGPDGGVWPDPVHIDPSPSGSLRLVSEHGAGDRLPAVERGIVIAGDGAGDAARIVAQAHGWPLFAEPTSGARAGVSCMPAYVAALTSPAGQELARRAHQVVVVGRPTLTRPVQSLIASAPALYVAAHGARWREAPRHATQVLPRVPPSWLERDPQAPAVSSGWLDQWREIAGQRAVVEGWNGRAIASAWLDSLGAHTLGVIGSSGPIRAVDRVAPAWAPGFAPTLIANRGLAGIDGTVATAIGVALGARRPVSTLIGDVTFLHDVGGLLVGPLERRPAVRFVVVNDGGGTIFSSLEHAAGRAQHVERVFTTPHGVELAPLAAAYGARHDRVTSAAQLASALRREVTGIEIVEAMLG